MKPLIKIAIELEPAPVSEVISPQSRSPLNSSIEDMVKKLLKNDKQ